MQLKPNFILRQVADTWVVLPLLSACADFDGMLTLNESGAMLWKRLENGANHEELVAALTEEYDVSVETARKDVEEFYQSLVTAGCALEY